MQKTKEDKEEAEKKTIFIASIPYTATKDELLKLCQSFGRVKHLNLCKYADGNSKGHAFCQYFDTESAIRAAASLNHASFKGRSLVAELRSEHTGRQRRLHYTEEDNINAGPPTPGPTSGPTSGPIPGPIPGPTIGPLHYLPSPCKQQPLHNHQETYSNYPIDSNRLINPNRLNGMSRATTNITLAHPQSAQQSSLYTENVSDSRTALSAYNLHIPYQDDYANHTLYYDTATPGLAPGLATPVAPPVAPHSSLKTHYSLTVHPSIAMYQPMGGISNHSTYPNSATKANYIDIRNNPAYMEATKIDKNNQTNNVSMLTAQWAKNKRTDIEQKQIEVEAEKNGRRKDKEEKEDKEDKEENEDKEDKETYIFNADELIKSGGKDCAFQFLQEIQKMAINEPEILLDILNTTPALKLCIIAASKQFGIKMTI